ncbi:MAG: hypothetical protein AB7V16_01170 [Vulcanibacillus sp.]
MQRRKMIAPIVITAIIVLYYIVFVTFFVFLEGIPLLVKILGIVIPMLIAGICIYVLLDRIKEIKSDDEDDLSKY